jgi:hypothetical protein
MITRGENKGRTVTYHNVLRRTLDLGAWTAGTHRWTVAMGDLLGEDCNQAAIMVQTGTTKLPGAVLGAAMAELR